MAQGDDVDEVAHQPAWLNEDGSAEDHAAANGGAGPIGPVHERAASNGAADFIGLEGAVQGLETISLHACTSYFISSPVFQPL